MAAAASPTAVTSSAAGKAASTYHHRLLSLSTSVAPVFVKYRSKSQAFPHLMSRRHAAPAPACSQLDGYPLDDDHPREECGVIGVVGDPTAAITCFLGLHKLQHRGEEGAGIVAASDDTAQLKLHRGLGLVSEVFDKDILHSLPGSSAIGHNRYSTAGAAASLQNVQPFLSSYRFGQLAVAHNGNLVNYWDLRSKLESTGSIFNTTSDTEVILHLIATSPARPNLQRIVNACEQLEGAYSLLFLTAHKLFAVRDPHGIRPLVMGRRSNGAVVFASETCVFDMIDAVYEREVEPGEVVVVDRRDMSMSYACLLPKKPRKACVFEHIYFAMPDSTVFGHPVANSREAYGRVLAQESPAPGADVVIPVPDSGIYAAMGFSEASGVPFAHGLLRSHYAGRSFIQPTQEIRDFAVKLKLSPVREKIEGRSVVVVDDSLVRGTTSARIVRMLRRAGAREVHMRIASPPVIGSCYYGIDTPREGDLIANNMDIEGVRKFIEADSLAFLSLDKLRGLLGNEAPGFCDACFSKEYPIKPRLYEPLLELED